MSVVDRDQDVPFERLPEFDLECMYDDWDDPSEVTVFSTDERDSLCSAWLTVDRDHAEPLSSVR